MDDWELLLKNELREQNRREIMRDLYSMLQQGVIDFNLFFEQSFAFGNDLEKFIITLWSKKRDISLARIAELAYLHEIITEQQYLILAYTYASKENYAKIFEWVKKRTQPAEIVVKDEPESRQAIPV